MLIIRESADSVSSAVAALASEGLLEVNTSSFQAKSVGGGELKRFLISLECSHKQLAEKIITATFQIEA